MKESRINSKHHGWLANSEKTISTNDAGKIISKLSDKIIEGGDFKFNSVPIKIPDQCHLTMRHERRPAGELVLKIELTWSPYISETVTSDTFDISNVD